MTYQGDMVPTDDAPACTIDGRCECPTCGVATAMLRGALEARGVPLNARNRVILRGEVNSLSHPALASIRVWGASGAVEVARIDAVQDVLRGDIIADVIARLAME